MTTDGEDLYTYTPLESDSGIRVVELLPKNNDSHTIYCNIHHTTIDSHQYRYAALSYTWGSTELTEPILCDGKKCFITANLHFALSKLRDLGCAPTATRPNARSYFIWVDALCINQSRDPAALRERERQVLMINRIFRQAQNVIADIGPLTNEPEGEIPIQKLIPFLAVLQNYLSVPANTWSDAHQDVGILKSFNLYSSADLVRSPLFDILSRPWFRRVWIIQEFVLAEQFIVIIANTRISGLHLLHGLARMIEHFQYLSPTGEGHNGDAASDDPAITTTFADVRSPLKLLNLREVFRTEEQINLQVLLETGKDYDATDERDRIYALLGLCSEGDKAMLPISYSESVESLCQRVTELLFKKDLARFAIYRSAGIGKDMPSWAFDLKRSSIDGMSYMFTTQQDCPFYNACGASELSARLDMKGSKLVVTGSLLDAISYLSMPVLNNKPDDSKDEWWYWLQNAMNSLAMDGFVPKSLTGHVSTRKRLRSFFSPKTKSRQLSGKDFRVAIQRTIVADVVMGSRSWFGGGQQRMCDVPDFERQLEAVDQFLELEREIQSLPPGQVPNQRMKGRWTELIDPARRYRDSVTLRHGTNARRLAFTESKGLMCLVPGNSQHGDFVGIFEGCPIPFVLRPNNSNFQIVGVCYVHDMMDGQALEAEMWKLREISIV